MCLAIPGRLVSVSGDTPETRSGTVSFSGVERTVNLAFAPEATIGDYVLVHVGFALAVIDEAEAEKTLKLIEEMEETSSVERRTSTVERQNLQP